MGRKENRKQVAAPNGSGGTVKEAAAWAALYAKVGRMQIEPPPKGWRTVAEIAAMIGQNKASLSNTLREKFKAGLVKGKDFRIRNGSFVKMVRHYYCEQAANQKD